MNKINRVIKKQDKSPNNYLSLNLEIQSSGILEREKEKDLEFSETASVNCITSVTKFLGQRGQSWAAGRQGRRWAAFPGAWATQVMSWALPSTRHHTPEQY